MSDVWFVRTQTGEARVTLDQLDAAYQAGSIDEKTQVREESSLTWTTLGELLGVEAAPQPETHSASVRPVMVDLDDIDETQLKPKKTGVFVGIAAGVLVLGGLAFAVTQFGGAPAIEKAAAAGGGQAAAVVPQAAPEPDPQQKPGLTEEQKKALEKADKDLATKQAAKADALREKRERQQSFSRPGQKSGPVFQKGGSKYDPLNQGL
jgi:hypothetical protein